MSNPNQASGPPFPEGLMPNIDPQALKDTTANVRALMTKPAVNDVVRRVKMEQEPPYGYWSVGAKALGRQDARLYLAMGEAAEAASRAKPAGERNGFDLYVLGTSLDVPADVQAPAGHRTYYYDTGTRIAESLRSGQLPEGFEDPTVLERTTALLVEQGLANFGRQSDRRSLELEDAAAILREATMRVPEFNPVRAGLLRLYDRSVAYAGTLQAESPHWTHNRAGRTMGDPVAATVHHSLLMAEEATAALYLQGREGLLAAES